LPVELKGRGSPALKELWPGWLARRDTEIRARLTRGDRDSLVNFLLFGTSYTRQPRITSRELAQIEQGENKIPGTPEIALAHHRALLARIDDLIGALAAPANNERLLFFRRMVEQSGYGLGTTADRTRVREYTFSNLARVVKENEGFAKALRDARLLEDPSEQFAERSKLFRTRGLSLDTSWKPNFAIEESLRAMLARGLVTAGSVRRAAIIGPGLDFTDKAEGYDFYPVQTLQPFALVDTLLRVGLARLDSLHVTTFDLSQRVNDHLIRARQRAERGQGYAVELLRDPEAQSKPEAIRYWEKFGDHIGRAIPPIKVPAAAGEVAIRSVRLRPAILARIHPVGLNIVVQRADLPEGEGFDLIVATNVFVYYDVFEQSLAVASVERMLRPGGFLLSNNALLELPSSRLHSVGYLTTVYSDCPDDGDHVVWYRRSAD
jgi:SAM-dependent methyltransferase